MLQIKKEASFETIWEYELSFDTHTNGGFAFPCNQNGEIDVDSLNEAAKFNYLKCINGEIKTIRPAYVKTYKREYYSPKVAICECGDDIELEVDNEGLCYCHCGNCYNGAGQSIRPRSEWEERYDDEY